ncbi:hypothetical protein MTO96_052061, partial [Rhipicephalus appendiculatus]
GARICSTVNWDIFRRLSATPADGDFLQHVVDRAKAATVVSRTKPGRPVPDLKQLQLWATRRRAEHRAIRSSGAEDWTAFRRLDAVCRRHANRRWKQGWEAVCEYHLQLSAQFNCVAASAVATARANHPSAYPGGGHLLGPLGVGSGGPHGESVRRETTRNTCRGPALRRLSVYAPYTPPCLYH